PHAALPVEKLEALLLRDAKFARTWARERPDLADQSASAYDLALAAAAVRAGWSDAEVVALLVAHRQRFGGTEKLARGEYLGRTLSRARTRRGPDGSTVTIRPGGLRVRHV